MVLNERNAGAAVWFWIRAIPWIQITRWLQDREWYQGMEWRETEEEEEAYVSSNRYTVLEWMWFKNGC